MFSPHTRWKNLEYSNNNIETAQAYIALVAVSTDATVLGGAIDYLTTAQPLNGSWNDDPYSTAIILKLDKTLQVDIYQLSYKQL